jgi:photosystem II stability/assembly factor-like uncharacterized protein
MQHAGADQPGGLWLGTEPGGLFFSRDGGQRFELVESLWNHPGRQDPAQWFGAGKDHPFIHSIVVDPRDSSHVYVAVSCAGVFETVDGGKTWRSKNKGLVAAYLPNHFPQEGHDPHHLLQCRSFPEVLWQQNHCGIFRSANCGDDWSDVSGANGFPKYGFALAIDHEDPMTAWVIPAFSDERRVPVDLRLSVCVTRNGGKDWITSSLGLPQEYTFDLVLRQALARKGKMMVFGTNNGNLYASADDGRSWLTLSTHLAPVNGVVLI